jgi:hypothetical protein
MLSIRQSTDADEPEHTHTEAPATPPIIDRRRPRMSSSSSVEIISPLAYRPREKRVCVSQPIRSELAHTERMEAIRMEIRQQEMIQEEREAVEQLQRLRERNQS